MKHGQCERVKLALVHKYAQVRGQTLTICDAMISCITAAVDTSFAVHTTTLKGSTVSLIHGNLADKKLFSVSIYPGRTVELSTMPTWEQLFEFALANVELLLRPKHALGTLFDDWNQVHVCDVVLLVPDRDEALALALRYGQVAIFDLGSRREIPISRPSEIPLASRAGGVNA
jgi:hypothetical protein